MENDLFGTFRKWMVLIIPWILAIYLLVSLHRVLGFPLPIPSNPNQWFYLLLSILLFLFPFLSRIRIGNTIEIEREISRVADSVADFKEETRNSLALITSTITTISNITSTVNVSIPGFTDLVAAREGISDIATEATEDKAKEFREELILDDEETIMPLARTRIQLEQLLRKILNKRLDVPEIKGRDIRFLSARSLFEKFLAEYPNYRSMTKAFQYVLQVCNAAIHGQRVPKDDALEALNLGAELLAILSDIEKREI